MRIHSENHIEKTSAAGNRLHEKITRGPTSSGRFEDNRPEAVAQKALQNQVGQKNIIQRNININANAPGFEDNVKSFLGFAKAQGGEAWEMFSWFMESDLQTLEFVSTEKLDSLGYTDCRINTGTEFKEAHTLNNLEWSSLSAKAEVKMTISLKNPQDAPMQANDASHIYIILHEAMVHGYPFYLKCRNLRAGNGPQTKEEAGYLGGEDNMNAHQEHLDLLHRKNDPFYNLYDFMRDAAMNWLVFRTKEAPFDLTGFNPQVFSDTHEVDIMKQFIEEDNHVVDKVTALMKTIIRAMSEESFKLKSNPQKIVFFEHCIKELGDQKPKIANAWRKMYQIYQEHTHEHVATKREPWLKPIPESEKRSFISIPQEVAEQLPNINPNAWNKTALDTLTKYIENCKLVSERIDSYILQMSTALKELKK